MGRIKVQPIQHDHNYAHHSYKPTGLQSFICSERAPERYQCDSCYLQTPLMMNLKAHIQMAHKPRSDAHEFNRFINIKSFTCKICNFETYSRLVFMKHFVNKNLCKSAKQTISKQAWFKCTQCLFKTVQIRNLKSHMLIKHTPSEDLSWLSCAHCVFKTKYQTYLRKHILNNHKAPQDIKWFECGQCPFKSKWKGNLNGHIMARHRIPKEINRLKCELCLFNTKWKSCMHKHMLAKHTDLKDVKWVQCEQCSYRTIRNDLLKRHVLTRHLPPEDIQWFTCTLCPQKVKRRDHLKRHMQEKHSIFEDVKWLKGEQSKLRQLLLGKYIKSDKCEQKSFKITHIQYLKLAVPEKEAAPDDTQWFECDQCLFKTTWNASFKMHKLMKHTDIKFFECDKCPYKTRWSTELETHMEYTHTIPVEWLKIEEQSEEPQHTDPVEENNKIVTWYDCDECTYRTEWQGSLKVHKLMQHAETEWFHCDKCLYKAQSKTDFYEHVQAKHATNDGLKKSVLEKFLTEQVIARKNLDLNDQSSLSIKQEQTEVVIEQNEESPTTVKQEQIVEESRDQEVTWFVCDQCPYSSIRNDFLRRHKIRQHKSKEDIKWFQCKLCSFKNPLAEQLTRHVRKKHPISGNKVEKGPVTWFECDQCVYKTEWKGTLKVHKLMKHHA